MSNLKFLEDVLDILFTIILIVAFMSPFVIILIGMYLLAFWIIGGHTWLTGLMALGLFAIVLMVFAAIRDKEEPDLWS